MARLELVIEEVEELARVANFKEYKPGDEVVVVCDGSLGLRRTADALQSHLPSQGAE